MGMHIRNRLSPVAAFLAIVLTLGACSDATAPGASPLYSSLADPEAAPMGIGGSVTITASGSFLPDIAMRPSGLTLPPGVPVRVTISGQITRTQTQGLKDFCSFFVDLCEEFAFFLGEDPVPPSGVPVIDAAVAFASWDGGEGVRAPQSGAVLTGPSGSELWVGRTQFLCEFSWFLGSGPCFTFAGSYTYTVHADDGDSTSARLIANVTAQALGPAGGMVDLKVETTDGSPAVDVLWYFVPDGGGVIDGGERPVVAALGGTGSPGGEARITLAGGGGARSANPSGAAGAQGAAAATTWTSLSSCDGSVTCHATIDVSAGTFVATALVHDTPRAAERRVSEGSGGGGAADLKVACAPEDVERGQPVTCTASVTPSGATLEIQQWRFSGGGYDREFTSPETQWAGQAVVGGTVSVDAKVGGKDTTATGTYTVRARAWAGMDVPAEVSEVPSDSLPVEPRELHDLGAVYQGTTVDPRHFTFDGQGPNSLIAYWQTMPLAFEAKIQVNRPAMQRGSAFWHGQRETRPAFSSVVLCLRSDVERFIPVVLAHEGIDLNERSHAGLYHRALKERAGPAVEAMTGSDVSTLMDATIQALEPVRAAAAQQSARADGEFKPPYCTFDFAYPSRK